MPVLPVKVDRDKVTRAQATTPMIESGKVLLPESTTAPWLEDFLGELCSFPSGLHDDWTDSVTQALNYLRQRPVAAVWTEDLVL